MSDSRSGHLTPRDITGATFETKRRGYDPDAVKAHLGAAAATVSSLQDERDALNTTVDELRSELEAAQSQPAPEPVELDEAELTERLGQHAARVLSEARSAGEDRIIEAEAAAADIRAAAEELYAERSAEADVEAQRIRAAAEELHEQRRIDAEHAAAVLLADAEAATEQARSNVNAERESADADADRIIREAELTRRQILEDLARRRSAARRQVEQLRAGRERLLASHETVRRALDEISEELTISMSEARAAAETAGHSVSDTTIEELENEIETARLTGLLDTGPITVVDASRSTPNSTITPAPTVKKSAALPSKKLTSETDAAVPEDEVKKNDDKLTTNDSESNDGDDVTNDGDVTNDNTAPQAESTDDDDASRVDDPKDAEVEDVSSSTSSSSTDSSDESAGSDAASAGLASVVQLDRARADVDTGSHPAAGRDATSRSSSGASITPAASSPALPSKKVSEAKDKAKAKATVTTLASVKDSKDSSTNSSSASDVGDLFASLRSEEEGASTKTTAKKKSSSAATTSNKKTTKKNGASAAKKKAAEPEPEPEVDSSEMTRRLKRVLADEQSRAMSTVKNAEEVPSLEDLLGSSFAHGDTYWSEVLGQLDSPDDVSPDARSSIDDLVATIRRRISNALETADDTDAVVATLRSVYRELKTQHIGVAADAVVRSTALQVRS